MDARTSLVGLLLALFACVTFAAEYELCARGVGETFTRTARVRLSVDGPDLGPHLNRAAALLIKQLVFKDRASDVYVEPYEEAICAASLDEKHELAISVTQAEIDQLVAELARGFQVSATIARLAKRARLGARPPPAAGPDKNIGQIVRVFYATNRKPTSTAPQPRFGMERSDTISYGRVLVSVPKEHRMAELEMPSILRLEFRDDPDKHILLKSVHALPADGWREELRKEASLFDRPGVLLFTHGYNVTFGGAATRTAQLAHDLNFRGPAVFFSWPSSGGVLSYVADEQAAEWSITDMQQILADLAGLRPAVPIYMVAHSMGNRVLARGFANLLDQDPAKRRQFKEVILTAPDMDAAVFRREIAPRMLGAGVRVTLYASSLDSALVLSRRAHGGYRRLGEGGDDITVLPGMDSIEASRVKTDFLGHSYFGDSGTVMADLFYLIRTGLPPSERFALAPVRSTQGNYWRFR